MEKKITKDTKTALATSLRVISNLEERVEVLKLRIATLEDINELLCKMLAHSSVSIPPNNTGTNNEGANESRRLRMLSLGRF